MSKKKSKSRGNHKAIKPRGPLILQTFVANALEAEGKTPYRMAMECGWDATSIYRKMKRPALGETIELMLAAVGARISANGLSITLGISNGKVVSAKE